MAKTKKQQAAPAAPAAGQQITKYYNRYAEDAEIRDAVLQFYLSVYANKQHPLHDECVQQEITSQKGEGKYQLFALLDCPDLDPSEQVLWSVAYAIKIRIDVYKSITTEGEPQDLIHSIGSQDRLVCAVIQKELERRTVDKLDKIAGMPYCFESLLPDESGKALIEYLQAQRHEAAGDADKLQVKQMSWAWIRTSCKDVVVLIQRISA